MSHIFLMTKNELIKKMEHLKGVTTLIQNHVKDHQVYLTKQT